MIVTMQKRRYGQVRINARDISLAKGVWKRREPTFGFPLVSVVAPEYFILIRCVKANQH